MIKILVVDDDKNIRYFLREALLLEKYEVFTASNGEEALDLMDKEMINLVIVDIMMPKMDGYEFTRQLREAKSDVLILMISAKQLPEDRKRGFKLGIDDYMSKPIDGEELILHVKALLNRSSLSTDRRIVIGDVVLDYDSFTVTKGDEVQVLPQKEFLLLYKLLSYPNKIFTRLQLMDEIWGMDSETGWETLTVHVGRLRKRFDGWQEFRIESIRGLGYKAVKCL
ncbi:MAG: response regulator transcription factor [Clostridia bacterium]|nr:response regulator transcription factor [Clostridia bacterium]